VTVREQAPQIARARAVAVTKTKSTRRLQPGDAICGNCGEGNPPTRKFCSRCGESLVTAQHVKVPWWRRFLPRRGPKVVKLADTKGKPAAAHRDARDVLRQAYRKARLVIGLALVAVGVVYGAYPPFRTAVNGVVTSAKTRIGDNIGDKLVPIHPATVGATAQETGHPAADASDEFFNTYWLAPWTTAPEPALTMTFDHPVTIKKLILYNGANGNYIADGRPSSLHLVFSNQESFTITPQDSAQPQTFSIDHAVLVKSVEFQITAIYQGSSGSNVAITEIELFGIQ
jgi:hypothetical protein